MLLIAIVDDDTNDTTSLKEYVENYLKSKNEAYMIQVYKDGVDFVRSKENFDIVFLDIRMNQMNGIEAAKFLRIVNKDAVLIFVTYMAQLAIKGYEVDALDFIVKPTNQSAINNVMERAEQRIKNRTGEQIILKTSDGMISVSTNNILYVEVYNHDLIYHTENAEYKVRGQLSEVRKKLNEQQFIWCNRSYIVNLRHVSSVHDDYLVVGGTTIQISKSHKKEIEQRFINYLGNNI